MLLDQICNSEFYMYLSVHLRWYWYLLCFHSSCDMEDRRQCFWGPTFL